MEIDISVYQADEPVAVMRITGNIDASNFAEVITKAQEAHSNPARNLIIDLSEVPYISSAGLVGIHKVALLYGGVSSDEEENIHPASTHSGSARKHVKLLSPQPGVDQILETAGMKLFFKVFDDLESALKSF